MSEFTDLRKKAERALSPVKPANEQTHCSVDFLHKARRAKVDGLLPEYYLIYLILVELLGYQDLGRSEKIAWSIPVDYNGEAYLIEHRKSGVGVFATYPVKQERDAREIAIKLKKAVEVSQPFFVSIATIAVKESKVNLENRSCYLFGRYMFFLKEYREKLKEANDSKGEFIAKIYTRLNGSSVTYYSDRHSSLLRESSWLALSAIDSFFSWTEHAFISIGLLQGHLRSVEEVVNLMNQSWKDIYSKILDIKVYPAKEFYDKLCKMREEIRNFFTHGAFGKGFQAFRFHSNAGAVPVLLPHKANKMQYALGNDTEFDHVTALEQIERFIDYLWSGDREPARLYIMESNLPIVLTMVTDGQYKKAMESKENMMILKARLSHIFTKEANMDY